MRWPQVAARLLVPGFLLAGPCARAQDEGHARALAPELVLDGAVRHPGPLGPAALRGLPILSLPVVQATGHGVTHARPTGVLLWDLLQQAGPVDEAARHAALRHTVTATGRDGYQAAFSFGELDPDGSGDPVLLTMSDGQAGLVVPGDRTGARDVHDVVRITVH